MSDQPDTIPPPVTPAWAKTELARHPQRPYPMDFIERIFTDFTEIHGDRFFGDDPAMACGMARFEGQEVMVIANLKGRSTKEKVHRRFGMPNPEGYRKALRCMKLAEKFSRPVIAIIDVPAAYPGVGAEERGQAEAIARNLREMSRLRVPTIAAITGEGGSGGALGLALADRVLILGDVLNNMNVMTGIPGLHEPPGLFTPDPVRNRASARRLAALRPALTCFGHGAPLRDPGRLADFVDRLVG